MSSNRTTAPGMGRDGTEALVELHTRLIDTIAGYDKVLEKAEPEFASIAAEFRELHLRQADCVSKMLIEDGHDPAQDGSIFGSVNRALIVFRAWFDDISTNIMDALVEGEKHVLDGFDAAIEASPSAERRRILGNERAALIALLDRHAS